MSDIVSLADVGKCYVKYDDVPSLLSRAFRFRLRDRTRRSHLWAVRHVNLDVDAGEAVGVIGRNGAGKSTMLRMLAGVTAPSEGTVRVRGRVAPLISVGVGFHPELTGRENVFVNGTVLGLTRAEIGRKFDDIVAFAEIGDFIDTPVKFYSSGMFVRLGFSVAVAAEPDVLLVDEVLAVGDFAFQMKCYRRMQELQAAGTTMLVVTHNLDAVRNLCSRVLVLHGGTPRFLGPSDEAIAVLHELLAGADEAEEGGGGPVQIMAFDLVDVEGPAGRAAHGAADGDAVLAHVEAGSRLRFRLRARFRRTVPQGSFWFSLTTEGGVVVYADSNYLRADRAFHEGEEACCDVVVEAPLTTGSYHAAAGVIWGNDQTTRTAATPVPFYVSGRALIAGLVDLGAAFEVEGGEPAS